MEYHHKYGLGLLAIGLVIGFTIGYTHMTFEAADDVREASYQPLEDFCNHHGYGDVKVGTLDYHGDDGMTVICERKYGVPTWKQGSIAELTIGAE